MNPSLARGLAARIKGIVEKRANRFAGFHESPPKTGRGVLLKIDLNLLAEGGIDRMAIVLFVKSEHLRFAFFRTGLLSEIPG